MIAVIADDLSGATELAGVAADAGFSAEVHTEPDPTSRATVIAFDADTRRLSEKAAARRTAELTRWVLDQDPEWIYKKTDSVLRGHVAAEIETMMEVMRKRRVIYVPANPSRNRLILEGRYFIEGLALDQTTFANDPDFPQNTSELSQLLKNRRHPERWQIPNVTGPEDIGAWANAADAEILTAGAVDFFQALLLRRRDQLKSQREDDDAWSKHPPARSLLVCGSAAAWSMGRPDQCQQHGVPVIPMPAVLFRSSASASMIEAWADEVAQALTTRRMVTMAIGASPSGQADAIPTMLTQRLASGVSEVMKRIEIQRVLLEGGATASAVLQQANWTRLEVGPSLASGIARLRPHAKSQVELLIKPGSYPWPSSVWPGALQNGESGPAVSRP